jgi:two-component system phosphate regulon sensor histidine kinase PhoR
VALDKLVETLVETTRLKAASKKIEVAVELPEELPALETDPHWLSEVLQNLLDNAVQYTSEGGHIRVRVSADAGEVAISVVDDGIGISQEHQARIFERFYRVDDARSRAVGGTGLGLAISRHIVHSLGGRIRVASEPGRGSTFTVLLRR